MKPLDKLSAGEIRKLHEKRFALVSANNRALIDAGFGSTPPSELRAMDHPLVHERAIVNEAWQAVVSEMAARRRWHGSDRPIRRA